MALVGNWNYPTSIRFGAGRIKELADACKAVGFQRPLLVTDPGLARLPMIADAVASLRLAGIDVGLFSEVRPNPVAILDCVEVPDDWHARFSCVARHYEYRISTRRAPLTWEVDKPCPPPETAICRHARTARTSAAADRGRFPDRRL